MDMLPVRATQAQWLPEEPGFFASERSIGSAILLYARAGSAHCICQGQPFPICRGSFLLLPQGCSYTLYAQGTEVPTLLRLQLEGFDLACRPTLWRHSIPEQIAGELSLGDERSEAMVLALSSQLILLMGREGLLQPLFPPSGEQAILSRALGHIHESADTRLSVPELAKKTGVSSSYLTALFHKHLPLSPAEFIRRTKLQRSKEMILEGALNLTQISAALEYSTVHQFSRQFKEIFGISPSEYAKQAKALRY